MIVNPYIAHPHRHTVPASAGIAGDILARRVRWNPRRSPELPSKTGFAWGSRVTLFFCWGNFWVLNSFCTCRFSKDCFHLVMQDISAAIAFRYNSSHLMAIKYRIKLNYCTSHISQTTASLNKNVKLNMPLPSLIAPCLQLVKALLITSRQRGSCSKRKLFLYRLAALSGKDWLSTREVGLKIHWNKASR